MQDFTLDPRVSERTDSNTFVVCEAIQVTRFQMAFFQCDNNDTIESLHKDIFTNVQKIPGSDDVVKGTPVQRQLNLFYPPQVKRTDASWVFFSRMFKYFPA